MSVEAPPLALYLHFPWCVRKCPYCDFNSHAARGEVPEQDYVDALLRDLDFELAWAGGENRALRRATKRLTCAMPGTGRRCLPSSKAEATRAATISQGRYARVETDSAIAARPPTAPSTPPTSA